MFSTKIWSQKKIYVKNAITKEALPFAQIKIGKGGVYTNAQGFFIFLNDSVKSGQVHYLGYKSKTFDLEHTDTLFLKPVQVSLDTIVIKHQVVPMKVPFLHINKRFFGSFPLTKKYEILSTIIPKDSIFTGRLKQVSFKLDKIIFDKKRFKQTINAFVKLNIYTNDTRHTLLFQSRPYKVKNRKKDLIVMELSGAPILLSKKGLMFGLEYMGHIDQNGNFVHNDKLLVRPVLTDGESQLYRQNTKLRDVFTHKIYIRTFKHYF